MEVASHMLELRVNGGSMRVEAAPGATLSNLLRTALGLPGTKTACDRGECGACTVLVDGNPVMSCVTLAETIDGEIVTIEGVADSAATLRQAFADEGAFQCGYCTPGQIMQGLALLRQGLSDDDRAVREAISGCICRCTGYDPILRALRSAADRMEWS